VKDGLHLDEAIKKGAVSASGSRIGSPSICCIRECRLVAHHDRPLFQADRR